MGLLDPLFETIARFLDGVDNVIDAITNPELDDEQATQIIAQTFEEVTPADEVAGVLVDLLEEFVVSELSQTGELTPENVEAAVDETEGAATAVLLGLGLAASAVEAATFGQVDKHQEWISQAIVGLGVDDVTGTELEARKTEGVMPALEAKVGKEHRSKFVNLQDAVEYALRNKTNDEEWLTASGATTDVVDKVGSNQPVNRENLVEEWGIRDDQIDILEQVSLEAMEFEELIETPAELGLIVPDDLLDDVLDLAGYPEELKDFLRQVPQEIPRSTRAYEERTTAEELVSKLDTLVSEGELEPAGAEALLPDEVDVASDALRDRWEILSDVPKGTPSRAQLEGSFSRGYIDLRELRTILNQAEYDTSEYEGVLKSAVLDELDGDLQEAVALGLVSETQYTDLCQFVGLDQQATDQLLQGKSLGDITEARLKEQTAPSERSVGAIQGIGQSRSTSLETVGIETIAQLAQADVANVAETTNVSTETAENWIRLAREVSR
jgi:hypothetical protein